MKNQLWKNTTFLFQGVIKKVFSKIYEGLKCSETITKYISNVYVENFLTYSYERTTIACGFSSFSQNEGRK